ncbi:MAG: cytochrome c [Myxococcales bacterium]|nr:cytochrome c [Myxococcales bacterium]MDP3504246.1 cytochrome c [Myxococcales bacterium]
MKKLLAVASAVMALTAFAEPPKAKPADAKPADAKAADAKKFVITGDAAKGQQKYKELCVACHGELGKGDGAAAAALNPKPANFADAAHAATVTDEYIYSMIKEGGLANGKSALMASWKASLNEAQLMDVAAYVRSLSKTAAAPAAPAADKKPAKK